MNKKTSKRMKTIAQREAKRGSRWRMRRQMMREWMLSMSRQRRKSMMMRQRKMKRWRKTDRRLPNPR